MSRAICRQCMRPQSVCVCGLIRQQNNHLPIIILRHVDERRHPLNTARLARAGLRSCQCLDGLDFPQEKLKHELPPDWLRAPALLYPGGEDARASITESITALLVLDGTWRNTRELLLRNPWLHDVPKVSIAAAPASRYRLRKAAGTNSLATIEAVGHVLATTDAAFDLDRLLYPFEVMIERQITRMGRSIYEKNYRGT
ncbi:MAG: tRNA-uridine aminocarboxypropyltransferase [Oleiphilaceae bacterium]|nr:tRNA-uridine aminocarboxypropyltransferase [Oleiphilaceae bacterium]